MGPFSSFSTQVRDGPLGLFPRQKRVLGIQGTGLQGVSSLSQQGGNCRGGFNWCLFYLWFDSYTAISRNVTECSASFQGILMGY
jgi:hypothetical protein